MLVGEASSVLSVLPDENLEGVVEPPEIRLKMRSGLGVTSAWSEADGLHLGSASRISSMVLVVVLEIPITKLSDVDVTATGKGDATARRMVQRVRCKVEGAKVRASASNLSACELLELAG